MTILCIETSTSVCSAAICKDGKPFKQCMNKEGSSHARLLPLYIENLLQSAREEGLTIDAAALSEGPGSYTGLRIGTSTAKGLCYGLNIPLIPVPTLAVLCQAAKERLEVRGERLEEDALLCPMIDARRMEVYSAICDSRDWRLEIGDWQFPQAQAVVVENEESLYTVHRTPYTIYYFGDGAAKCQSVLTSPNWHYIPDIVPEAQYVGVLAERIFVHRTPYTVHQLSYYEPYYLKEFIAATSHIKGLN